MFTGDEVFVFDQAKASRNLHHGSEFSEKVPSATVASVVSSFVVKFGSGNKSPGARIAGRWFILILIHPSI